MLILILTALLLSGCAGQTDQTENMNIADGSGLEVVSSYEVASTGTVPAPQTGAAILDSSFHKDKAQTNGAAYIDTSAVQDGYVAVAATADKRLKFQVICGAVTYNYDMKNDGTPSVFPLQCGDGSYKFRIMKNVQDKKYAEMYSVTADVKMKDIYQPFLRPSAYVNYNANSQCVKKAAELVQGKTTDMDKIKAVYSYVCATVKYDREKAATVQSGYLPTPDETMRTGKGICFDYASLAAAMLRSQGIPTRVIFGYVSPDGLYHAWNMFYTQESGWVTVSYQVSPRNWTRMDLTFSANGADGKFIGDGGNYKDVYMY